jgi:hypothetical protein
MVASAMVECLVAFALGRGSALSKTNLTQIVQAGYFSRKLLDVLACGERLS